MIIFYIRILHILKLNTLLSAQIAVHFTRTYILTNI